MTVELDTATAAKKTLCTFQSVTTHELPVSAVVLKPLLATVIVQLTFFFLLEKNAIKALGITIDEFFFSRALPISSPDID